MRETGSIRIIRVKSVGKSCTITNNNCVYQGFIIHMVITSIIRLLDQTMSPLFGGYNIIFVF